MRQSSMTIAIFIAAALVTSACAPQHATPAPAAVPAANTTLSAPVILHATDVPAPAAGAISQRDPLSTTHAVTRVMRLAPNARIPEHHHPGYEESFTVHQGDLTLILNDQPHRVMTGDVVIIPRGTVVSGTNGATEAIVIVAFASDGSGRAFMTPGRPMSH